MNKLDRVVRFIVVLYMTVCAIFGWHAVFKNDDESVKEKRNDFSEADAEESDEEDYASESDSVDVAFDAAFDAAKAAIDNADLKGLLLDMIRSDYNSWDAKSLIESKLREAADNDQFAISEAKDLRKTIRGTSDPDAYTTSLTRLSRKVDDYIDHKAELIYNEAKFSYATSKK